MPDCFWVSSFELNFLDKNSWVSDNQIEYMYSAYLKDKWMGNFFSYSAILE